MPHNSRDIEGGNTVAKAKDSKEVTHAQALERFDRDEENVATERNLQIKDLEYLANAPWPDDVRRKRVDQKRPMISVNIIPSYVDQVVGDMRQNKISIKIRAMDENSDEEGARVREGLIRQIEYASNAENIYLRAGTSTVQMGYGAWRVNTRRVHEGTQNQEIYLQAVNPHNTLIDSASILDDGSDATHGFIFESMKYRDFEHNWPDAKRLSWQDVLGNSPQGRWYKSDELIIAEYYYQRIEPPRNLLILSDGTEIFEPDLANELGMSGDSNRDDIEMILWEQRQIIIQDEEKIETKAIYYCKMSGAEILEGPTKIAGKYIPIIPVYGKRINIKGEIKTRGLTRNAIVPSQLYNYQLTAQLEVLSLQPKVPYIGTPKQFEGHPEWNRANLGTESLLKYNPDPQAEGKPAREAGPQISQSMFAASEQCMKDIQRTTGIHDASLGAKSNETSGRAILARQRESDNANFAYQDNLALSVAHTGRVILDMIPDVYDSPRTIRTMAMNGDTDNIKINQTLMRDTGQLGDEVTAYEAWRMGMNPNVPPDQMIQAWQQDPEGRAQWEQNVQQKMGKYEIDLTKGRHDVVVSVGPAYASARLEAQTQLIEYLGIDNADPRWVALNRPTVVGNMDHEAADEMKENAELIRDLVMKEMAAIGAPPPALGIPGTPAEAGAPASGAPARPPVISQGENRA